ncbi:hypothetical protein CFAEC_12060 [Corynebacterium faecale]|uniref:hypothetical protein n=1 Tax=Corynebacterium faecale TaxID=1758466 RepID=UPI0025B2912C|nr:hypothetical protein [Corynebacterium faecale]WJY93204.1 hypothetical protein CFAEC_12060 [Corynebacterium faecale]
METLVLLIAALILAAGIALWTADARSKKTLVDAPPSPEPERFPGAEVAPSPEPEPDLAPPVPDKASARYDEGEQDLDNEMEADLVSVPEVSEPELEIRDPEPAPAPTQAREESQGGVEKHSFLQSLPGSQRRERKQWASRHGFDFIREDAFLTDEWSRGAASTGAVARDVASGMAEGYETHLVDLAGVPVMAMRRGRHSEVVIDARRETLAVDPVRNDSDDLAEVDSFSGFTLLSNMAGVAQRFVDERVRVAFEAMPEAVTAVWFESDWVLAETLRGSTADDWEDMLRPLALLTDASFTLPPRPQEKTVDLRLLHPTRSQPPASDNPEPAVPEETDVDLTQPLVIRPEEPLQMPVRGVQESRGVVEPRALGADDVDSIADGRPTPNPRDYHGTRVIRELDGDSSIFDDSDENTTPPGDWDRNS